jgi:signal transduction histidine kinase
VKRPRHGWIALPNVSGSRARMWLAAYFLGGLAAVFLAAILFTGHLARKMEDQAAVLTNVFSQFISETAFDADRPGAFAVIENILQQVDFPVILTDAQNVPFIWRGVDVPAAEADEPGELAAPDLDPSDLARRHRLDQLVRQFDAQNAPYPIQVGGTVQAYVHFGPSQRSRQLRWMPWILMLVVSVFVAVGLLGLRSMKRSEQRSIWVGMARETAHQLGTPLTSLLGWVQLLQGDDDIEDGEPAAARQRRQTTYKEMAHDLERLSKVSARFSKIGATPDLVPIDLGRVIDETVQYMRRRTPHLGAPVEIQTDLEPLPQVLGNRELLEWVLENLLKNAIDALQQGGRIRVSARADAERAAVELRVADNGKGIPPALRKQIWSPGFTTKKRGWGLGLTLVRRIIEEYHGGRIWIEDNADHVGVCFAMRLPAASETGAPAGSSISVSQRAG